MRETDTAWVPVTEFGNRIQAELAANLLGEFDIECILRADDCGGMAGGQSFVRGVAVLVRERNAPRSREILEESESDQHAPLS